MNSRLLHHYLVNSIVENGSITVDYFMHEVVSFYYKNRINPIGLEGDFITSPEISQLFGEVIAAYIMEILVRIAKQKNKNIILVELGGGYGTLMSDILRTISYFPDIAKSIKQVSMIESSDIMGKKQRANLYRIMQRFGVYNNVSLKCYDTLDLFEEGLLLRGTACGLSEKDIIIFIANEFFDALPVKQFAYNAKSGVFREICVKYDFLRKKFIFFPNIMREAGSVLDLNGAEVSDNAIVEVSPVANAINQKIARLIRNGAIGSLGIFIDYGYLSLPLRSTIQCVYRHKKINFENLSDYLGISDVSALVDFHQFIKIYNDNHSGEEYPSAIECSVVNQGDFLVQNYILDRAEQILSKLNKEDDVIKKQGVELGVKRLIEADQMGEVFKVFSAVRIS